MEKIDTIAKRPKMQFLEEAFNDIVSTIGNRHAESGGLLFGKEDDYVVRKFIFDKHANVTGSTYTFNTEFLNPEIKRLWNDESLSCIGFVHSHPNGYNRLSQPDIAYFTSMFESMPRKHYLTPIVFTASDGGFKMNAHILPNGSNETLKADIEILPDDYYQTDMMETGQNAIIKSNCVMQESISALSIVESTERIIWIIWKLIMAFGLGWFILKALYILINNLNKFMPL